MSNVSIVVFILFVMVWLYSIVSIFSNKFKDDKAKVFWAIGVIFVPFLAFFYLFMKKNLLK